MKRPIPLSDWVPKIIKLFKKSDRPTQKKGKKEKKKSEIMNRKGKVESDEK